jgi:hypothetical protein
VEGITGGAVLCGTRLGSVARRNVARPNLGGLQENGILLAKAATSGKSFDGVVPGG